MDLNEKEKKRYLFLQEMYNQSDGNTNAMFSMWDLGKELLLEHTEIQKITDYLIGEDLIEAVAIGGFVSITHAGLKEVEQAMKNPEKPTEHFPAINIIHIGTMSNSTLQQGTLHSTINAQSGISIADLTELIGSIHAIRESLNLTIDLQKELMSELHTIEIQKKSPKPKWNIIGESLKTIRSLLENVAANELTPVIVGQISRWLQ